MKEAQFFRFARSFNENERVHFTRFLESPYHNQRKDLISLWEIIQKELCSSKQLEDFAKSIENIHHKTGGSVSLFRKRLSELFALSRKFVALEAFLADDKQVSILSLGQMLDRDRPDLFTIQSRKLEKAMILEPKRDAHFFEQAFEFAHLQDQYFTSQQKRIFDPAIQYKADYLDLHYLIRKFRLCCEMIDRANFIKGDYQINLLRELIDWLDTKAAGKFREEPAIRAYRLILQLLEGQQDGEAFQSLKGLLDSHADHFGHNELADLYKFAQNYCIRGINRGRNNAMQELFKLYLVQLRDGVLLHKDRMAIADYKNIVTVGCRLREYDWVAKFLEEYRFKLPEVHRDNVYYYNLASYYYHRGDFDGAAELLRTVQMTDVHYEISCRYLLLKIYYENRESEALLYAADAFRLYLLRNKKISQAYRRGILSFLSILKRMVRLREDWNYLDVKLVSQRYNKIKERLVKSDDIYNSGWLKEKFALFDKQMDKVRS